LDEYAIRKKIIESKTNTRDKVIIEDWNLDDEDDVSAVKTVSPVKTNETQTVRNRVDKIGQIYQKERIGFKKIKTCFVCKSIDHLIKDYDFYAKKSPEPKMKTVVNIGQRVVKPVWDNAERVNQQKNSNNLKYPQERRTFIPSGVLTRTSLVNPVRPNGKRAVHTVSTARLVSTARPFAPKIAQTGSVIRPIYPSMDNVISRASYSPIKRSYYTKPAFRSKNLKQDVKTFGVKNITTVGTRAVVNTGKGKMDNDLKKSMWIYKYYNGGAFVAFGSDSQRVKYWGKVKIRTVNLDFDDVYFVDELKFNLFSVSQMCDKKNSVLFTDTECLILSPSFKLLDENQVVLRAPRQNGVYSLDLKNIVPSGGLENQLNHKVKIIRSDHGTEFKNHAMNEFCAKKGIKREFSVARTPQQNEAVNTACYVLNRVLVTKPQNKTPYELLIGKPPSISFMRPFGCPLTILNTLDPLGKFDGKSDEGYLLGYSTISKAFRVYNQRTKRVEENMHVDFLKDQPNVVGSGPDWMFDLDFLTNTMNYIPVSVENQVNVDAGTQEHYIAGSSEKDKEPTQEYVLLPLHPQRTRILVEDVVQAAQEKPFENSPKDNDVQDLEDVADKEEQHTLKEAEQALKDDLERMIAQEIAAKAIDNATRQAFEEVRKEVQVEHLPPQGMVKECEQIIHEEETWKEGVYHGMEYMETKEVVDKGRQSGETEEVKLIDVTEFYIAAARQEDGMKEEKAKEKGVSIKDVDDSSRPARSSLTLKPLVTIDPKDKGKGVLKESPEREERQRHDQASVDYIASLYDEVQAKMDASEELAARLQMERREREERDKRREREDEKMIDKMNKKAAGMDEEEVPEESESTKVKVKKEGREENIKKRSGRRLKMKATKKSKRQKTNSDLEEEEQLRASLKIVPDEEEEIDYEVLGTRYPIVNWESAFYHTDRYGVPHDYYRVFRANESSRYIKTFTEMVSRFDRLDFIELHSLVMQIFSTTTPEGFDLVL
ncbi:ribonuclease H-like domain-containing protein, partial [Tanacetum coccineum]